MDGELQAAEASGFVGFLDAASGEFGGGIFLILGNEDGHAPSPPNLSSFWNRLATR